jgi:hypothetical protein
MGHIVSIYNMATLECPCNPIVELCTWGGTEVKAFKKRTKYRAWPLGWNSQKVTRLAW